MNTTYYKNLDALRGLAALVVVHSHFPISINLGADNFLQPIWELSKSGDFAVNFFFILSGFLITSIILSKGKLSWNDLKNFYMRRILRIWPLYFTLLIINFFIVIPYVEAADNIHFAYKMWKHLLFISNFDIIETFRNGYFFLASVNITWSISIEEQFYLFWPLIFLYKKIDKTILLFTVPIFVLIFFWITKLVLNQWYFFSTPYGLLHLVFGGLIAYLNFFYLKDRLSIPQYITFLLYIIIGAYFSKYIPTFTNVYLDILTKCLMMGFVLIDQALNSKRLINLGNVTGLTNIGLISYGVYLLHPLCILMTDAILERTVGFGLARNIGLIVIGLPVIYFISFLSYHKFEKYFLRYKQKFP